jgi:hypothetical protein
VKLWLLVSLATFLCLLGSAGTYFLLWPPAPPKPPPPVVKLVERAKPAGNWPETEPPAGLPIVAWGKRGHFPVIRQPQYLNADEGDALIAGDEPVLGLVVNGQAWAYPTNQLNDHEMVIDDLAGTPVLVTY